MVGWTGRGDGMGDTYLALELDFLFILGLC